MPQAMWFSLVSVAAWGALDSHRCLTVQVEGLGSTRMNSRALNLPATPWNWQDCCVSMACQVRALEFSGLAT